jgi:branched-chain amino acid transport system substrate-binding protein
VSLLRALVALAVFVALLGRGATADQPPLKVGVVFSFTGAGPNAGPTLDAAIAAYQRLHGDTVAGRKVIFIKRDDGGTNPDVARREAQELVVQEHVDLLMGIIYTPNAAAVADIANSAHIPLLLVNAVASGVLAKSKYMARFSFTTLELTTTIGAWAAKQGYKNIYVIYHDQAAGLDANAGFTRAFTGAGGTIAGSVAVPLSTTDFSAYVQRAKDAKPDAIFTFLLATGGSTAYLHAVEAAGIQKAGIKLLTTGDFVAENSLPTFDDSAIGITSIYHYSAAHDSALNRQFKAAFLAESGGKVVPDFQAVATFDILNAIYKVAAAQNGTIDPDKTMDLLRGMKFESPRGPIMIDPDTRDIVQNLYMRRTERKDGKLQNTEFETFPAVKSPEK